MADRLQADDSWEDPVDHLHLMLCDAFYPQDDLCSIAELTIKLLRRFSGLMFQSTSLVAFRPILLRFDCFHAYLLKPCDLVARVLHCRQLSETFQISERV